MMDRLVPALIAEQLESMIAFADAHQDFVLAAWLAQALDRVDAYIPPTKDLPSAT